MSLFTWIAAKVVKSKINLLEDSQMDDTKKWYQSKGVWTGIVTALMGAYVTLAPVFHLPVVPEWIFALLGTLGIYTRVTADSKIN